jgi:hypothetical protein
MKNLIKQNKCTKNQVSQEILIVQSTTVGKAAVKAINVKLTEQKMRLRHLRKKCFTVACLTKRNCNKCQFISR